jgi:hypothetical protein
MKIKTDAVIGNVTDFLISSRQWKHIDKYNNAVYEYNTALNRGNTPACTFWNKVLNVLER